MSKAKTLKTLAEETFGWIESVKNGKVPGRPPKTNAKTNAERQRFLYIRKVALKEIEDLRKLAECLPEDQLNQIFTEEQLLPLFKAIFRLGEIDPKSLMPIIDEQLLKKKRERLLPLLHQLFLELDHHAFSGPIADPLMEATKMEGGPLQGIRAIYYRSMLPIEKK